MASARTVELKLIRNKVFAASPSVASRLSKCPELVNFRGALRNLVSRHHLWTVYRLSDSSLAEPFPVAVDRQCSGAVAVVGFTECVLHLDRGAISCAKSACNFSLQAAKSFEHAYPQTQRFSAMQFFQPLWFPPVLAQKLPMNILFYPGHGLGTRPVLVDIYGGAWQHGSPSVDDPFDRHMAGIGYAVFAIDYRHAPAFHFPAQIEDVQALAYVRTNAAQYHGDASKIVLCGRSSGGELALLAAYDPAQAPVSAVIAFYSPSNLVRGFHELPWPDPLDVQKILADYIGGSPEQFADAYRAASPVTLATRRLPPTLLIQGGRDHVVSAQFTRQLYSRVKQTGSDVYLLELPWAEHSFDAVPSGIGNQVAMHALEAFLKTTAAAPLSSN
jgi:acetyl esterase/lipase